jgi:hypothetical protein
VAITPSDEMKLNIDDHKLPSPKLSDTSFNAIKAKMTKNTIKKKTDV